MNSATIVEQKMSIIELGTENSMLHIPGMISIPLVVCEPQSGNVFTKAISHLHTFFFFLIPRDSSFHNRSYVTAKLSTGQQSTEGHLLKPKPQIGLQNPIRDVYLGGIFLSCLPELEILEQSGPLGLLQ